MKILNEKEKFVKSVKNLIENKINASCNILITQNSGVNEHTGTKDTKVFDIPVKKIGRKFYYATTEDISIERTPFSYWNFSEFSSFLIARLVENAVLTLVICTPTKQSV